MSTGTNRSKFTNASSIDVTVVGFGCFIKDMEVGLCYSELSIFKQNKQIILGEAGPVMGQHGCAVVSGVASQQEGHRFASRPGHSLYKDIITRNFKCVMEIKWKVVSVHILKKAFQKQWRHFLHLYFCSLHFFWCFKL